MTPAARKREAVLVDQHTGITRQRARVARHIDNAADAAGWRVLQPLLGSGARRIKHYGVPVAPRPCAAALIAEQIGGMES